MCFVVVTPGQQDELPHWLTERILVKVLREEHCAKTVANQPGVIFKERNDFLEQNPPLFKLSVCTVWHRRSQDIRVRKCLNNGILPTPAGLEALVINLFRLQVGKISVVGCITIATMNYQYLFHISSILEVRRGWWNW